MTKIYERECVQCGRDFTAAHHSTRYCGPCQRNNKSRNGSRNRKNHLDKILVGVDCEGEQGTRTVKAKGLKKVVAMLNRQPYMYLKSVSIGREDGSRASFIPTADDLKVRGLAEAKALHWLVDMLYKPYVDTAGKKWKQVPVAYHFGWDISTLLKENKSDKMELVHKSRTSIETVLCGYDHEPEDCHRVQDEEGVRREFEKLTEESGQKPADFKGILHRRHQEDVQTVLGEGGDTDVLAWNPDTKLAIAASPGRRLWVEFRPEGDRFQTGGVPYVDIHDVGRSFVGRFEDAIDSWNVKLQAGDRDIIARGKQARETGFKGYTERDIADYSEAECVALALMVRKFLNTILAAVRIRIPDASLFGSGSVAGKTLRHYNVPRRDDSDLSFEDWAKVTYFGGLIDAPVIGLITDVIMEPEDINSAYPDKLVKVPCTLASHGQWLVFKGEDFPQDALLGHIRASWFISRDKYRTEMMPFIDRWKDGTVSCPRMTPTPRLVTLTEFKTARKWFPDSDDIEAHGGTYWNQTCECDPPFAFLETMYDERQRIKTEMGKLEKGSEAWWEMKVQELAIKLIINSVYGKLAQQRPQMGSYTNLHLASYITGATRAQARDRIWEHEAAGGTLLYCHTDGITIEGGVPKKKTNKLGEWGAEDTFTALFTIQSGIAVNVIEATWDPKKKKFKVPGKSATRGVSETAYILALQKWLKKADLTKHPHKWPPIVVDQQRMVSRREAEHRNKPWLAGTFKDHTLRLTPLTKKRNLADATQLVLGNAEDPRTVETAWALPAIDYIPEDMLAAPNDLNTYRSVMEKRYLKGEFDGFEFR